ncbi:hypothetical protein WAB17_07925 [Parerythrobacter aurantius]|uniref:hypothetical protein n=1 Tax=Parerythrobacter aurantius TaxID=3127706 RepID=UPI003253F1BC
MRRMLLTAVVALSLVPVAASAQEEEDAAAELTETLRDPRTQDQMAASVSALSRALLDMDLAPLAEAIGKATGEPVEALERGRTLREMSPDAERVPEAIERELPQAMDRMADMGDAFALMLPALRQMAEQISANLEQAVEESTERAR